MLKLNQYNEKIRKEIEEEDRKMTYCNVACDECGEELMYVNYYEVLLSYPSEKEVYCPKCGKKGYMIVRS